MYKHGWYQIAFRGDLRRPLTPAQVGAASLAVVNRGEHIRVYQAICPHRGANLATTGRLSDHSIRCGFHGYRIALGARCDADYCVDELSSLCIEDLVFVRLSPDLDNGFADRLREMARSHTFFSGFRLHVRAAAELVIENGFDAAHFAPVHGLLAKPRLSVAADTNGGLIATGMFNIPASQWQRSGCGADVLEVPYTVNAYSPGLAISTLGGDDPYAVITAATESAEGECDVRVSLAFHTNSGTAPTDTSLYRYVLQQCKKGFLADKQIWESVSPLHRPRYSADDQPVLAFQSFCRRFHG